MQGNLIGGINPPQVINQISMEFKASRGHKVCIIANPDDTFVWIAFCHSQKNEPIKRISVAISILIARPPTTRSPPYEIHMRDIGSADYFNAVHI